MGTQFISAECATCFIYPTRINQKKIPELDKLRIFLYFITKDLIMWPFNRKEKKKKPAESIKKTEIPQVIEKTYAQWKQEFNKLEIENTEREDQCAKDGDSWQEMLVKTREIKEKMAHADKMMRKLQEPTLTYNKKWKGTKMELSNFIEIVFANKLTDLDGEGYYATETAKTDIIIRPSDIKENLYRDDFPYVLWFAKKQE